MRPHIDRSLNLIAPLLVLLAGACDDGATAPSPATATPTIPAATETPTTTPAAAGDSTTIGITPGVPTTMAPAVGATPPGLPTTMPTGQAGSLAEQPVAGPATDGLISGSEDLETAPELLSQTGLFADLATQTLGPEVRYYAPKYALWSDGSEMRRWVRLPAGAQIDTTEMDYWRYPVGTKLWKEFAKNGQVLEVRYMAKYGDTEEDWVFMAYKWDPALNDGVAIAGGEKNTAGTDHDIPSDLTCLKCHEGITDRALGFSAVQLSHADEGVTLTELTAEGRLTLPPAADLNLPGDGVDQQALGYLHANCGHCHNPVGGEAYRKNGLVLFWQNTDKLASAEQTITLSTLTMDGRPNLSLIAQSIRRMKSRPEGQMPSVATEFVDDAGVLAVEAWLGKLTQQFPQEGLPDLSTPGTALPEIAAGN